MILKLFLFAAMLMCDITNSFAKYSCEMIIKNQTSPTPTPSPTPIPNDSISYGCPDIQETLQAVNKYRKLHQVPPLQWDDELANSSNAYAKYRGDCVKEHSPDAFRKYGENLYCNGGYPIIKVGCVDAINIWYYEVNKYDFKSKKPYSDIAIKTLVTHFTALVWKGTTKIGCGARKDMHYPLVPLPGIYGFVISIVCRFYPPGNVASDNAFLENVFPYVGT